MVRPHPSPPWRGGRMHWRSFFVCVVTFQRRRLETRRPPNPLKGGLLDECRKEGFCECVPTFQHSGYETRKQFFTTQPDYSSIVCGKQISYRTSWSVNYSISELFLWYYLNKLKFQEYKRPYKWLYAWKLFFKILYQFNDSTVKQLNNSTIPCKLIPFHCSPKSALQWLYP